MSVPYLALVFHHISELNCLKDRTKDGHHDHCSVVGLFLRRVLGENSEENHFYLDGTNQKCLLCSDCYKLTLFENSGSRNILSN